MPKAKYKTKQMTELLIFMQSVQGRHVTVSDISDYFEEKEISVGTTTIYRHLEKMVREGLVAKYVVDGSSSACFEYIGETSRDDRCTDYHCKCEKCGKLIHLQCSEVENLRQHVLEHHRFEIDSGRTVFYGICDACKEK